MKLNSIKLILAAVMAVVALQTPVARAATNSITLANYSFETNTSGTTFKWKLQGGFDESGTNNVAGWLDTGTTYLNSGVDYAGDHSNIAENGSVFAYCENSDNGAYQITSYQMVTGNTLTLTWWAKSTAGSSGQTVSLLSGTSTSSAFSSLTVLATSTAALSNTGDGGAYTQYTLTYTPVSGDAGHYVAVSFEATPGSGGKWAAFDNFALSVVTSGGGPGPVSAAHSTVSPATASIPADGTSTQVITVQARDTNNVNETTGGATVV